MRPRTTTHEMDAIVLAGGQGKRMGRPKALMSFGDTTLVRTVVTILQPLFHQVLVVGPETYGVRALGAIEVEDTWPGKGPLGGLATGLEHSKKSWSFLVGCDMPFVRPDVVIAMARQVGGSEIVVGEIDGMIQPFHAFYNRMCIRNAKMLLEEGSSSLSLRSLIALCHTQVLSTEYLKEMDSDLKSYEDLDTPDAYRKAVGQLL